MNDQNLKAAAERLFAPVRPIPIISEKERLALYANHQRLKAERLKREAAVR
jgi:hypothetical protein